MTTTRLVLTLLTSLLLGATNTSFADADVLMTAKEFRDVACKNFDPVDMQSESPLGCLAFFNGWVQGFQTAEVIRATYGAEDTPDSNNGGSGLLCIPDGIDHELELRLVLVYIDANENRLDYPASLLILEGLLQSHGCE